MEPLAVTQGRRGTTLPSLRDFIEDTCMPWFKAHHKGHENTQHTLCKNFDLIMPQRLDAITGRDLEQIRTAWMQAGNKASTVNRKMGAIRMAKKHNITLLDSATQSKEWHLMRGCLKALTANTPHGPG